MARHCGAVAPDTSAGSERTRLRRGTARGRYDHDTIVAILDAGLVCHVGFSLDGRPWVFPTAYGRIGDHVYLHGASANFGLRALAAGAEACITVTIVDGLVLARSAFHHSMNYRSVMLFGPAVAVTDPVEKRRALLAIVDHMVPGRSADTRPPSDDEMRRSLVVRVPTHEASAKVRTGGPVEEPSDIGLPYWAGHLPVQLSPGLPVPDVGASHDPSLPVPGYLTGWSRHTEAAGDGIRYLG